MPPLMIWPHQRIGTAALQQPGLLGLTEEVGHRDHHDTGSGTGEIQQRPGQAVVQLQRQTADVELLQLAGQTLDLLPQGLVIETLLAAQQRWGLRILVGMFGDGVEQAHWAHLF